MPDKKVILIAGLVSAISAVSFLTGSTGAEPEQSDRQDNRQQSSDYPDTGNSQSPKASALAAMSFGPNTIADLAERAAPAVVNIEVDQEIKTTAAGMPDLFGMPIFGFDSFDFFYNGKKMPKQFQEMLRKKRNTGSGFLVRANGYIVTNTHVVKNAKKVEVTLSNGDKYPAKVVGTDSLTDLAVIKIEAENLPVLKIGSSKNLRPGEFAIAIGSPLGLDHSVTMGIISAVGRTIKDISGNINFIQTDAAINQGNSGGPLLNLAGEVIGVNTAIQQNAQNIGFSIPADLARETSDALIEHKKIFRPWLGIRMRDLTPTILKSLGVQEDTKGMMIEEVLASSPASEAGLRHGDIILKIDGQNMFTAKRIQDYVRSHQVGDKLNFFILRSGTATAFELTIGEFPDPSAQTTDRE